MLTQEENDLLTRVGPGTSMGRLFRSFWIPVLLAEELPEPDGSPVPVTVLGEPLVAFRDTAGRIGLLDAYCAHRGTNLFWGRNEEHGLRCVYHGWKYDIDGNIVETPAEPADSMIRHHVKQTAYPAQEAGGVIWAYMGGANPVPGLPQLEWTLVPPSHRYVHKRFQESNYLQNVEGEVDSSHVSFLHRRLRTEGAAHGRMDGYVPGQQLMSASQDTAPVFLLSETDYGLVIGARRDWDAAQYYWRVTQFLMPSYTMIPSEPDQPISFTAAIPIDDTHTWGYTVTWHPERPLSQQEVARIETWTGIYTEVEPGTYRPILNKANHYRIDREKQRTESYTGIRGIREQDLAVQEDQRGPITDRTREHLGAGDAAVSAMRRQLLAALKALDQGADPEAARRPESYRIRSLAVLAPREQSLMEVVASSPGVTTPV